MEVFRVLMNRELRCMAVGAGAIGKAVSGYIFSQICGGVVFADIAAEVLDDINTRGGYQLVSSFYGKPNEEMFVGGVSAVMLDSREAADTAAEADVICTAVGPGMSSFLPILERWLGNPNRADKPLYLLLFENDFSLQKRITEYFETHGGVPSILRIVPVSIERMAKIKCDGSRFDVMCESFIPVIVRKDDLAGSGLEESAFFQAVDKLEPYYYRKLYTNNLGHAVLGYAGITMGCDTIIEAMAQPKVRALLEQTLAETCLLMEKEFGFAHSDIESHRENLMLRYQNTNLADELERLIRDPIRKLSSKERIVGAMNLCKKHGISWEGIKKTLAYALKYYLSLPESVEAAIENIAAHVLETVCGILPDMAAHEETLELLEML